MKAEGEPVVFMNSREGLTCGICGKTLERDALVVLDQEDGAKCLSCSKLDHLVFLPSGSAVLSRRARKNSALSAVVLKFSRTRRRNERQGILVEEEALREAEEKCLADEDVRQRRRERDALRREELDTAYVKRFADEIRRIYPGCPDGRELEIAEHACRKHSGRVGRTAAAKEFDPSMIELAVRAHIRHAETAYDELLSEGYPRELAREEVKVEIERVVELWEKG